MRPLDLTGLKAHHPLGFLAACGLLRVAGGRSLGLGWKESGKSGDRIAVVSGASRDSLIESVAETTESVAKALKKFGAIKAEVAVGEFRTNAVRAENDPELRVVFEMLPAVACDLLPRPKGDGRQGKLVVATTDLAMTSGRQDLFSGILAIAERLAKRGSGREAAVRNEIERALFGPWGYEDDEHSLGWDPSAQRLHALRNKAPTCDNQRRSIRASVFLATQALPLFPCFAVGRQLRTTGFHHDDEGDWFAWPIWREPISLDTLRSLVAHPFESDLRERGVEIVYRCRRAHTGGSQGDYHTFSHSEVASVDPGKAGPRAKPVPILPALKGVPAPAR